LGIVVGASFEDGLMAAMHLDFHKQMIENTTPGGKFGPAL
jgi:hypothetical protein